MAASQPGTDPTNASMRPIDVSDLETSIRIKKFMPYEHRMLPDTLQQLTLSIHHPTHGEIGYVIAIRVQRRCYGLFLEVMDVDHELFTIASTLFDRYAEIRPWLVDNEYHRGSGVWGRELNEGKLTIVTCVHVDAKYRKQGIASWALQQLYRSVEDDKMLCWPSPVPPPPADQWIPLFDGIVEFFRKVGYRRVGATAFFAYSQDPEHPSRKIHLLHDFDPDDRKFNIEGPPPILALQYAVFHDNTEKIVDVIKNAHALDPGAVSLPDAHGFRPILVAVRKKNLHALRTLISLGLSDEDFDSRDNKDHLTPLEACNADMCSGRDFEEIFISKGWEGHSDISLYLKAALKRAMGHPMPPTDEEYVKKKKWGCTCDKCLEGWLSPRTLIRLNDEAGMAYDTAREPFYLEQMTPKEPLEPRFIGFHPVLSYIPIRLWPQMFKTFILGFGTIMNIIAQLLSRHILPTQSTVLAELQNGQTDYFDVQSAKFFFNKGGRVEYALAAIINNVEASFVDLSETDMDIYKDDDRFLTTPSCANDREFDIVKKNMGLDPTQTWGPYDLPERRAWAGMDSDEDSDEDKERETEPEEDVDEDENDEDENTDDGENEEDEDEGDEDDENDESEEEEEAEDAKEEMDVDCDDDEEA